MFIKQGTLTELDTHRFSAEASELRMPPGFWPGMIATELGNGLPFIAERPLPDGGMHYRQELGCITLDIYNDYLS
jgi:hypothetical protein